MIVLKIILTLSVIKCLSGKDCHNKLSTCIHIIQPFLHIHHYMFPANITDIQNVCKRWSELMECVRLFMNDCSTDDRKTKFNDAVRVSVHIVHAICSSEKYQRDYLDIAECFKEVSVNHCGDPYQKMIDQASDPFTDYQDICCGYTEFQRCVSTPLRAKCGSHAHSMMDQFLSFLVSHCSSFGNSVNNVCKASTLSSSVNTQTTDSSTARQPRHFPTRPWSTRTIIYPMNTPTSQSRRSSADRLKILLYLDFLIAFLISYKTRRNI